MNMIWDGSVSQQSARWPRQDTLCVCLEKELNQQIVTHLQPSPCLHISLLIIGVHYPALQMPKSPGQILEPFALLEVTRYL